MKRNTILSSFSLAVLIAAGPVVAQDRNGAVINKAGVAVKLITTRPGKLYDSDFRFRRHTL